MDNPEQLDKDIHEHVYAAVRTHNFEDFTTANNYLKTRLAQVQSIIDRETKPERKEVFVKILSTYEDVQRKLLTQWWKDLGLLHGEEMKEDAPEASAFDEPENLDELYPPNDVENMADEIMKSNNINLGGYSPIRAQDTTFGIENIDKFNMGFGNENEGFSKEFRSELKTSAEVYLQQNKKKFGKSETFGDIKYNFNPAVREGDNGTSIVKYWNHLTSVEGKTPTASGLPLHPNTISSNTELYSKITSELDIAKKYRLNAGWENVKELAKINK